MAGEGPYWKIFSRVLTSGLDQRQDREIEDVSHFVKYIFLVFLSNSLIIHEDN